jgi:hypothetical protein
MLRTKFPRGQSLHDHEEGAIKGITVKSGVSKTKITVEDK